TEAVPAADAAPQAPTARPRRKRRVALATAAALLLATGAVLWLRGETSGTTTPAGPKAAQPSKSMIVDAIVDMDMDDHVSPEEPVQLPVTNPPDPETPPAKSPTRPETPSTPNAGAHRALARSGIDLGLSRPQRSTRPLRAARRVSASHAADSSTPRSNRQQISDLLAF
ncbi:MAG: hypothetical protein ABW321_31025, partial [Polyangiales bacterium]